MAGSKIGPTMHSIAINFKESLDFVFCNLVYNHASVTKRERPEGATALRQYVKSMNWEKWMEVIQTTHRFEMDYITTVAVDELGNLISAENYATLAKFAHTYHLDHLTQLISKFIAKHPEIVIQQIINTTNTTNTISKISSAADAIK